MKRILLLSLLVLTIHAPLSYATTDRDFWYRMATYGTAFLTLVSEIPYFISGVESANIADQINANQTNSDQNKKTAGRIYALSAANAGLNGASAVIATSLALRNVCSKSYPLRSEHPRTWRTLAYTEPLLLGWLAVLSGIVGWTGAEIYSLTGVSSHSLQVCTALWIPEIVMTGSATLLSIVIARNGWKLARPKVVATI